MGWLNKILGNTIGGKLLGLGEDNNSQVDGVNYAEYFNDPIFTDSQDFLSKYSKDLLTNGPNDYYKPIGEYGSDEFLKYIDVASNPILKGTSEALARSGRGRGGLLSDITAQATGEYNQNLVFQDYLRAMQGRQWLMGTGLNTQANVRDAGFANQGTRNQYNANKAEFDLSKAMYGDQYDRQQSQDFGKMMGTIAPIASAGLGFMVGGPAGASAGYSIGNSVFGGSGDTPKWLDVLSSAKGSNSSSTGVSSTGVSPNIGKISGSMDSDQLMKLLAMAR
jgi:hypothetical protein